MPERLPSRERRADTCPTCGQAVAIEASGEGTSYYIPVAEARHVGASAGQAAYKAEAGRLRVALSDLLAELAECGEPMLELDSLPAAREALRS